MKKTGFTLAEILITLAIVGIVAALAIPSVITKASRQAEASKLSSVVTDLENAFGNIMTDKDADNLFDVLDDNSLREHLNYTETESITDGTPFKTIGGGNSDVSISGKAYTLKNNAKVIIEASSSDSKNTTLENKYRLIFIDTNSSGTPGRWGRDGFCYLVGDSGKLYPRGGTDYHSIANSTADACSGSSANGLGCADKLAKNNYKVDY